ncbi:MAG: hypothetical protein HY700_09345 [Gemmatimonadetes bacterium]|nr:hypothetical protein [Gemmatimonadota bacterium]
MKNLMHAAIVTMALAGTAAAQQPAPQNRPPGPPAGAPPAEQGMERRGPGPEFGPPGGFAMMAFSPTVLLERRQVLNLTADQVTRLSTLENDLKAAHEKAQTDAKPHREELEKLWQQPTPDVAQLRTHAQALMQVEQTVRLSALTTTAQAKAILTPEQRGRVQGWADARGRQMRERMQGGPGGPGMRFRRPGMAPGMQGMPRRPMGFGRGQL